ncbi:MAG: LuxR C-terminal-related transcriptional regulator [Pseudomonadota bacterium]
MNEMYVRTIAQNELYVPPLLREHLIALEATRTSEDVWTLLLSLAAALDLPIVEYIFATDHRNWEQVQFIRTTVSSDWIPVAQSDPDVRRESAFRTHSIRYLTPYTAGWAYVDDMPGLSPKRRAFIKEVKENFGVNSSFVVPLRMTEPGQAAHIAFGGPQDREVFDELLVEHGWTLHTFALSAHMRYVELFKSEFLGRNQLTDKQKELLQLLGLGLLDKQIAHELGISFSAVRQRLAAVQQKTGTSNRAELAALAMRVGLVADPLLKSHGSDLTVFLSMGDGKTGVETLRHEPQDD